MSTRPIQLPQWSLVYCYTMTGTALATIYPTVINSFSINLLSKREREREKKKKDTKKDMSSCLQDAQVGASVAGVDWVFQTVRS